MSRITAVATARLVRDLHTPFVTALRRTSQVSSVVVRVTDADGHSGYGEAPQVWRLHMVGEPAIAAKIPPAIDAHARIDDWNAARDWILARLAEKSPAPATEPV